MAQQIINLGTSPNDGEGDNLRGAFDKVNDNFTEVYTAGPVGSNISISGATISTTVTNANLTLSPNGTGKIIVKNDTLPDQTNLRYIGSSNLRYRGAFIGTAGINSTGDIITTGNITANNIRYTGEVFVGDLQGSVFGDDSTVIIDGINNVVSADSGVFTNITAGNILPAANVTYNLGSPTAQWKELYVSGNTIYLNGTALSVSGNVLSVGGSNVAIDGSVNYTVTSADVEAHEANLTIRFDQGNTDPYTINLTDGSLYAVVASGTINTETSLVMIGKNYNGYGEFLNENFIKLLESGANTSEPAQPLTGQLWYDKTSNILKVYNGTLFKSISGAIASSSTPTSNTTGDLWWDTTNNQLKVYNGSSFTLIGPSFTSGEGTSGAIVDTITDSIGTDHVIVQMYVSNTRVGIWSKDATFTPASALSGFATIGPGLNLNTTVSNAVFRGKATEYDVTSADVTQHVGAYLTTYTGNISADNIIGDVIGNINTTLIYNDDSTELVIRPSVSIEGSLDVETFLNADSINVTGQVTATNFIGNLTGTASSYDVTSGDVTQHQGNITAVGTLTGVTTSGNITGVDTADNSAPTSYTIRAGNNTSGDLFNSAQGGALTLQGGSSQTSQGGALNLYGGDGSQDGTINLGTQTTAAINVGTEMRFGDWDGVSSKDSAVFGDGLDLRIYHDGTDSWITDNNVSGNLNIATNRLEILGGNDGAETLATFVDNGAVSLYYDNNKKFETTSVGVTLTGEITTTGGNSTNWQTAYSWGDHSTQGYITGYTVTSGDVTAHQANLSITESQISDLGTYVESDTTGITGADQVTNIVSLTQAEYDAITPNASTVYIIVG